MKVLIVEDDKVLSLLLSKMMERLGFEVLDIVTKGIDAITVTLKSNPDLIMMDIMLEDEIDGISAMQEIRKHNNSSKVIYITGNSDPQSMERASLTNFVDYLIKPVEFNELKRAISSIE